MMRALTARLAIAVSCLAIASNFAVAQQYRSQNPSHQIGLAHNGQYFNSAAARTDASGYGQPPQGQFPTGPRLAGRWYEEGNGENGDVQFDLRQQFEQLRQTVEAQQQKHDKEIDELKSALKGKVDPGHTWATMKVVGRVHVDYWAFPESDAGIDAIEGSPDGPQDRFGFRRMRFGVRGKLPANMEYRIEAEFAGGNVFEFRDAWLGWNDLPFLQKVLVGNQKRPYGLDHINSSRYNVFMERPFVVEAFNQDARRLGIASYSVSDDQAWNWRYGVFNQRLIQDEGAYISDHYQLEFAARLANTCWYDECSDGRGYGHWAISGTTAYPGGPATDNAAVGPDKSEAQFRTRPEARSSTRWLDTGVIDGADDYQLLGLEGVLNFGSLQLVGEYEQVWMDRDQGFGGQLHFHGGYLYAAYFLTGEHMPWNRRTGTLARPKPFEDFFLVRTCDGCLGHGWGAWQVAARLSYGDFSDDNILGGTGDSYTLGLNWFWTPYARMQFNWLHGRVRDNGVTRAPQVLSGDYDIVGARFMVDF